VREASSSDSVPERRGAAAYRESAAQAGRGAIQRFRYGAQYARYQVRQQDRQRERAEGARMMHSIMRVREA